MIGDKNPKLALGRLRKTIAIGMLMSMPAAARVHILVFGVANTRGIWELSTWLCPQMPSSLQQYIEDGI
jgi:hypothetical protein